MKNNIRIGNCGYGRTKRDEYPHVFPVVEIQQTFYQPPQIKTLEKWRAEVPAEFEFTLKAWQLITHESSSPTFRRLRRKLTDKEMAEAGFFKPTEIVREALETTLACAKALKARTILFQCPAKFKPTTENIENLRQFINGIKRGKLNFAWEPRGGWDPLLVKDICEELDLWHTVDPFVQTTATPKNCYFRLHGTPRWRYTYEEGELEELASMLPKRRLAYVFFNNITMREDAVRLQTIVDENNS